MKKQLVINTLSFDVHTEAYDGDGDTELADCRFTIDRKSHVLTMTDFHTESGEQSVILEGGQMAKLLRYIVHTLEIFMWEQDYCLRPDEDDVFTDIFLEEGIYEDELEEGEEERPIEPEGRPSWRHRRSTATILCRIFLVMKIICQIVQKNCTFLCWSILSRKRKNFDIFVDKIKIWGAIALASKGVLVSSR
jgi:hypothetical protein